MCMKAYASFFFYALIAFRFAKNLNLVNLRLYDNKFIGQVPTYVYEFIYPDLYMYIYAWMYLFIMNVSMYVNK